MESAQAVDRNYQLQKVFDAFDFTSSGCVEVKECTRGQPAP